VRHVTVALLLGTVGVLLLLGHTRTARAQSTEGASMTVLRGEVAVLRTDGSAVQPAPSGTVIYGGDEIRTLTSTGALITFQVGTEIELGDDTILVIERVSRQGERIDVSVKQVQGATLHRVASFSSPGSAYRVEAGGVVTQVRGTEFLLYGPLPNGVVILVCTGDCDARTTFGGKPLSPGTGYYVVVENGKVLTGPEMFKPDFGGGLWNAAFEAGTMVEQLLQGDTDGVPPGQVSAGQRTLKPKDSHDVKDQRQKGPAEQQPSTQSTGPRDSKSTPSLSIDDVSAIETNSSDGPILVFTVTRSGPTDEASAVNFTTADGSASDSSDYLPTSGTLIFPPGSTSQTISVQVLGDPFFESDEAFFVNLSSPLSASIDDGQGVGTILNDDGS
jgi:hypothetical protein